MYDSNKKEQLNVSLDQCGMYSYSLTLPLPNSKFRTLTEVETTALLSDIQAGAWKYWTKDCAKQVRDENGQAVLIGYSFDVDIFIDKTTQDKLVSFPPISL